MVMFDTVGEIALQLLSSNFIEARHACLACSLPFAAIGRLVAYFTLYSGFEVNF